MLPLKIEVTDINNLKVVWDDRSVTVVSLLILRKMCPCAICDSEEKKHTHSHNIYRENQLTIDNISIVGNYALSISWKDGHSTGIYEFQYLRNISESK